MRLLILFCLTVTGILNATWLDAQTPPAAIRLLSPVVGVTYDSFDSDYTQERIKGVAAYASISAGKFLGLEGEARRTDLVTPQDVGEQTYLAGPQLKYRFGRFSPYVKVMGGIGVFRIQLGYNTRSSTEHYGVFAYGGGLDVSLSSHIVLRALEYEGQVWHHFPPHGLTPSGLSSGIGYRF